MIRVIDYEESYHEDFRRLNREWLEKYQLMEPQDLETLDHPYEKVIAPGGYIFLAMEGEEVVGTAGLFKEEETVFELIKMSVDPGWRGKGISRVLLDHALETAKAAGARKIFLYSNSQLTTAIKLYEKYGFQHVENKDSPLLTADVKMELILA